MPLQISSTVIRTSPLLSRSDLTSIMRSATDSQRLDGIGYEIEENLLQLHPIACHRNKRFIQFSVHDNSVPLERALHQSEHLMDELHSDRWRRAPAPWI